MCGIFYQKKQEQLRLFLVLRIACIRMICLNLSNVDKKNYLVTKMDRYNKYQTKQFHTHTYTAHTIVGG